MNTHLESTYQFDPTGLLQSAQTAELLASLDSTGPPVVLCGDFNSNAELGPEQTASVSMILKAGFTDVWRQFNHAGTGYTWPIYSEDFASGPAIPIERIDLIFTRGVGALTIEQTGITTPWSSDHAGVVATHSDWKMNYAFCATPTVRSAATASPSPFRAAARAPRRCR